MKNKKLIYPCLIIVLLLLASCAVKKVSNKNHTDLMRYETVVLPTIVFNDASMIQAINHLCEISKQRLKATTSIADSWKCGISYTVLPISENKKLMRKTIKFKELTIYEAFEVIALKFNVDLKYENGRFVFSDPETEKCEIDFSGRNWT